jgi:drug/metabolite transporter (DMT)-like permease
MSLNAPYKTRPCPGVCTFKLWKKNSKYSNISLRETMARTRHRVTSLLQYSSHSGQTIARMKDSPGLHLKTYVLIFFMVLFAPLGNVLLSKGMKEVGSAKDWAPVDMLPILAKILTSPYIWLGIACLLAFFVAYMLVLTWADYSYVQPASAFSYAVVAVLSYFLLGEVVPPLRWVGIAVICVGVLVVGRTPPRTTERT